MPWGQNHHSLSFVSSSVKAQVKDLRGNQIETHQDQRDHHTDFGPGKPVFRFRKQANRKQIDDGRGSAKIKTKIQAGILGNHNCKSLRQQLLRR